MRSWLPRRISRRGVLSAGMAAGGGSLLAGLSAGHRAIAQGVHANHSPGSLRRSVHPAHGDMMTVGEVDTPATASTRRDADGLGHRNGLAAPRRPHAAQLRGRRRGQGDRDRAGPLLPGLDLQRPRAGPDHSRHRGRAGADRLRERRLAPALDALPRHPLGTHGRRARAPA